GRQTGWVPHPTATVTRYDSGGNFATFANDVVVAYGSALRWKVTGDTAYADQAIAVLNSYTPVLTRIDGDSNYLLLSIQGYQFAAAAEIMRSYSGWPYADFHAFRTMLKTVFVNQSPVQWGAPLHFLINHNDNNSPATTYSRYWSNWDLSAINCIYAIGVLCDDTSLTNIALDYFYGGRGTGCIDRIVNYIHPGNLGQTQEAGRDQGHNTLGIALLATFCEMPWKQGIALYGYKHRRVLAGAEYVAKYSLDEEVPFAVYGNTGGWRMTGISTQARGSARPGWEILYNHYVNRKGLAAPWSAAFAEAMRPSDWAGADQPGFDTLTASLDPIATGAAPSGLTVQVTAQQPVLSWWGTAYATSYTVKRSTTSGSGYTTIASGLTTNTYTDTTAVPGTTYYYVVSASLAGGGATANSNQAQAVLGTALIARLKFDETGGTTAADATGNGWTGTLVNGATWTAGKTGNAVNLASASSQ